MRAAVYHGPRDIRIEDVPAPMPGPDDVLVRVLRSGLCGTDVTEWVSGPLMIPLYSAHAHSGHSGPMIQGHEILGEVMSAPADSSLSNGQIVASGAQVFCGECERCREGRVNICERLYTLGLNTNGGHAEYVIAPVRSWVPVPSNLSLDHAGLVQPLAVGLHAARRSGAGGGDFVLISGAGAIGSFVLAALRHLEPALEITLTDVDALKLERAQRLGADHVMLAGAVHDREFDVTIEASGAPGTLARCIELTRVGGRVLAVGMPARPLELDIHHLVLREITLDTTVALITQEDMVPALEILSTTGLGTELLDSVQPLSQIAAVLDAIASGRVQGKVLLDPRG
ncbi:zinc-binding alcohol dehydrogenase [Cryobacterium psychrophilum]|uniref:Zinc-binding alcohol dehydrogenase n=2 Tax=Cryobacterium psychrophilum TaxID=41988 RepID=A0A4Y8KUX2_9MICO|nr:zinc-binding alcohol dehydrogenase [Cryobacterium psychrophilum]